MKTIFTLLALTWAIGLLAQTNEDDSIYTKVEVMPQYIGGDDAFLKYLGSIPYPAEAKNNDISGAVYVKCVIDTMGNVTNVDIAKSSGSGILDSASIAHISKMPAWKPGYHAGKPVRVQYIVPIKFVLVGGVSRTKNKRED